MSNVVLGIIIVGISFLIVGYGFYFGYEKMQENSSRSVISASAERLLMHIDAVRSQLGRVPATSELEADVLSRENRSGMLWTYVQLSATSGYLCGRAPSTSTWRNFAMQKVADDRGSGVKTGGACDTTGGPSGGFASITFPVN